MSHPSKSGIPRTDNYTCDLNIAYIRQNINDIT